MVLTTGPQWCLHGVDHGVDHGVLHGDDNSVLHLFFSTSNAFAL